jgi:hypothetical protein
MKDQKDIKAADPVDGRKQKLPYERPAVISAEVFETLALSCGSSGFACPPGNPDRS